MRGQLPAHPPTETEPFDAVLADLDRVVVPGLTHWQHPSFFAYFPANTSYPSILGDLAAAGLGVNGMSWATSPACTEVETLMLDWMVELLGLPDRFRSDGPGAASSRARRRGHPVRHPGGAAAGDRRARRTSPVCPATWSRTRPRRPTRRSRRACASPASAPTTCTSSPTTTAFAMRPDALAAAIAEDRAAGLHAVLRVRHGRHHVDHGLRPRARSWPPSAGARGSGCTSTPPMAGIAALCPELRWVNAGLDQVDSYCTNPHKWMGVNFDCDLFWVADRAALLGALSILPEYLRTAAGEAGAVIDYRDWQIPLGRRFRALKLWFTLRCDGVAPIQAMIRRPRRPGPRSWPAGWPPTTGSRSWPRTRSTSSASPTAAATRRPTP